MALLETTEILQMNDKVHTFVLINPNQVDDDDVDLFVVQPPAVERDPAHHAPIESVIGPLCSACRAAFEYFSFWLDCHKSGAEEAAEKPPAACLIHQGAKTLQVGEDAQCHLCVLLMANLRVKRIATRSIDQSNIEMCWQSRDPKPTRLHFALTHRGHPRSSSNYWNILKLKLQNSSEFDETLLGITTTSQGLERHSNTRSEQSRDNALEWLKRCQENEDGNHIQCNPPSQDWLPTRLLDVASAMATSTVKLVQPRDDPDAFVADRQYVTLSHCWGAWGGAELPVLTTENLSERLGGGLPVSLLPQTFNDALEAAHWFNVRWLWIDSLCILQDSNEDWQKEAVMMYDVYKNALLNISADDSPDARWGCFRERQPLAVIPMHLRFPDQDDGTFWLLPDTRAVFDSVTESPLAKRGWVFQERQLSRRVLHFTSSELVWECCAKAPYFASETFPGGTPFKTAFNGKSKFQSRTTLDRPNSSPELYATWRTICEEYSAKVFSHVRDKLVALSGLAQEFEIAFPDDTYVAGMWRSTLPGSLLWGSSDSSSRLLTGDYVAPSWSWVSIDGPITPAGPGNSRTHSLVDITSVAAVPVIPSKPTALLQSASIGLRCYLQPVEVRPDYEKKPWYMLAMGGGKLHKLLVKDKDGRETACIDNFHSDAFHYSFDVEADENSGPESVSGYFLPLCLTQPTGSSPVAVSGLLVEPASDDGSVYRRVGILHVYGSHCYRLKYNARKGSRESVWADLSRLLEPTDEHLTVLEEGTDSDTARSGDLTEKQESGFEISENKTRDNGGGDNQVGEPRVEIDLNSVDALERLYALDATLHESELALEFERLVPRQITLI
ncbi:heterokaryon incompatibility protein-domain-containing protein [Lasiosphaeris hirsuta]|uniref:Heterokaryon incompatibility protein-domain-containing protein n=1 Tax=Lasiosphaeris hirsuta TaxID=260670 RepID=A0AA40DUT9_9PEZI|nr:heterokaryon incompatibility protein-domain-containing protein [Lasiosphaeris hirsuta]